MTQEQVDENGQVWGWWGSCQYDSSYQVYMELKKMGREKVRDLFQLGFKKIRTPEEVSALFVKEIQKGIPEKEEERDEYHEGELKEMENFPPKATLKMLLDWCRDHAWDLWSATPFVAGIAFEGLKYTLDSESQQQKIDDAKGLPILNQLVQGEADNTGFCCWLLNEYCGVPEEAFQEFDT